MLKLKHTLIQRRLKNTDKKVMNSTKKAAFPLQSKSTMKALEEILSQLHYTQIDVPLTSS